ncbi:MAG: matrixin family metalloprotease [Myxococcales bacterium]|nr:matrixin family metalloprotease [Myxococcales bacterium]
MSVAVLLGTGSPALAYTVNTTEDGHAIRWSTDTVALRADQGFLDMLSPGEAYSGLAMAFDAWRGYPGVPDLIINEGEPAEPGHHPNMGPTNTIHLLKDWPYEDEKLAVTVITYELANGRLLDADILVNGQVDFGLLDEVHETGVTDRYDLAAVLTHEAGHMLGLGESDADDAATMWPYARPGDTHQRTLAADDEVGIMWAYSGPPPAPATGCGKSTVAGRRASSGAWLLLAGLPLIAVVRSHRRRPGRAAWRRPTRLALAGLSLCGLALWTTEPAAGEDAADARRAHIEAISDLSDPAQIALLRNGMVDADPSVRLAVAEQLARLGHREQRNMAEHLRGDDNVLVRRAAVAAMDALVTAPPSATRLSDHDAPHMHGRLNPLAIDRAQVRIGHAHRVATERSRGLLFTRYEVVDASGAVTELRLPGGTDGVIAQRVGGEPLPPEGAEVAVMPGDHGQQAWTYHAAGKLFGGSLGDQVSGL